MILDSIGREVETVELEGEVEVVRVTPKAVVVRCEDLDVDEQLIPQSLVDWDASTAELKAGSGGTLHVARWFAEQEGLA